VTVAAAPEQALSSTQLFTLREAIARTGEAFAEFRARVGAGGATPPWDAVVLTCATESQAAAAREELERRRPLFPANCALLALPDPAGGRVGSGGATLLALENLAARWVAERPGSAVAGLADVFNDRRVLLIHSGGESQRLPAYAALGKIFAPLPVLLPEATLPGAGAAIFDWLYLLASALPGAAGEVTLLSGDVMPVLDPLRLERERHSVRGIAIPVPAAHGQQFGVYVRDVDGAARRILQKPDAAQLATSHAVDRDGSVAVDTGIVTLRPMALDALIRAAGLSARGAQVRRLGSSLLPAEGGAANWDLYRDWLPLLGRDRSLPTQPSALNDALERATRGLVAGVAYAAEGAFVHLGTSRDFRDAVAPGALLRRLFPFASQREAAVESGAQIEAAFVGRSLLGRDTRVGPGAVVDFCRAEGALIVERGAMASGLHVPASEALRVAPHRVCYQTLIAPSADGEPSRVAVVLGIEDNPKLALDEATFQGLPLREWLSERGLAPADLWPHGGTQSLWEAKLFTADVADPLRAVLSWLQQVDETADPGAACERWRAARRYSLHDLLDLADAEAIASERTALMGDIAAARVVADVETNGDESFAGLFAALTPLQRERSTTRLESVAGDAARTALHRARYWRILADLADSPAGAEQREDRAAAAVREAVSRTAAGIARTLTLRPGARVRVQSPVRVDFGGGWTDTPPFSLERGGAVLNAALTLDGELPVWAEVEVLDRPEILLEAADLSFTARIRTPQDVAGCADPTDPFALHKACLVLSGIASPHDQDPLARLRAAGAGLRLHTGVRIPRGSGLGGSSVVGAAALRALGEVLGAPQDDAELSRQTLELEQLMTTGGGWQD
ncbi:MAG TPA: L-fucokinase, partial [Chloroflexota bacterium]|nr:L-fucokinase [Chloroflexota bacterium]